jgi:hypothetical protein
VSAIGLRDPVGSGSHPKIPTNPSARRAGVLDNGLPAGMFFRTSKRKWLAGGPAQPLYPLLCGSPLTQLFPSFAAR